MLFRSRCGSASGPGGRNQRQACRLDLARLRSGRGFWEVAVLHRFAFIAALSVASACSGEGVSVPAATPSPSGSPTGAGAATGTLPFVATPVADFDQPWAMTFLPDGRMLVTEKTGDLLLVAADGGSRRTVATLPVDSAGQGGLMDVVLAPDFARSGQDRKSTRLNSSH